MPAHPAPPRAWARAAAVLAAALPLLALLCLLCGLAACQGAQPTSASGSSTQTPVVNLSQPTATPDAPLLALSVFTEEVKVAPTPLRAGYPFTITGMIHNDSAVTAPDVPVLVLLSAKQEELGFTPFVQLLTVTVPATQSVPVNIPVHWNLAGGEYRLWVQVNCLPDAWQPRAPTQPEENLVDNLVLIDLMIDPFDAYTSDLCPGRVDLEVSVLDVLPDPEKQQVLVQIHNLGNRAVYNVPVIVLGRKASGMTYTPAIPPCGGTARVEVVLDQPFVEGESFSVRVNPAGWEGGLVEENYGNNEVSISSGLPGAAEQQLGSLHDYDFRIDAAEIEVPQEAVVFVRVYNLGTRDASNVPILVTNEAGRKLTDAIPLVQGGGSGVAAIRVAPLWNRGGKLTFAVNPEGSKGGYPETNRQNNVATFALP